MRILVTGGAGYIGGAVAAELVKCGDDVVVLDNLSSGHREALAKEARLVQADAGDRARLDQLFRAAVFDGVMHFAASNRSQRVDVGARRLFSQQYSEHTEPAGGNAGPWSAEVCFFVDGRALRDPTHSAYSGIAAVHCVLFSVLVKMAKAYSEQAKNEKADTLYTEALGLVQSVGSDTVSAGANLSGAELFLNEGRFAGGQERATLAIPSFQKQAKLDSLIRTYDLTAQSLLGENKCNAAKRQLDAGRGLAMRTQDPTIRLSFQVTEWRVRARCGHASTDAKAGVENALSVANGRRLFNISLYARAALIEIATLEGKIDSASLMIDTTSRDAISHGFIQRAKHIEALRAKK